MNEILNFLTDCLPADLEGQREIFGRAHQHKGNRGLSGKEVMTTAGRLRRLVAECDFCLRCDAQLDCGDPRYVCFDCPWPDRRACVPLLAEGNNINININNSVACSSDRKFNDRELSAPRSYPAPVFCSDCFALLDAAPATTAGIFTETSSRSSGIARSRTSCSSARNFSTISMPQDDDRERFLPFFIDHLPGHQFALEFESRSMRVLEIQNKAVTSQRNKKFLRNGSLPQNTTSSLLQPDPRDNLAGKKHSRNFLACSCACPRRGLYCVWFPPMLGSF